MEPNFGLQPELKVKKKKNLTTKVKDNSKVSLTDLYYNYILISVEIQTFDL